jgi:VanZ family protein
MERGLTRKSPYFCCSTDTMKLKFISFFPAILWLMLSVYLLTLPGSNIPHEDWFDKIQLDKWVHIAMFFILCFLFDYPFKKSEITTASKKRWFIMISIFAILYGVAMEFVQKYWIPMRSCDVWDMVADSIGSLAALWVARKYLLGKV